MIPPKTLLPRVRLPDSANGVPTDLATGRGPAVILLAHSPTCDGCRAQVRALADQANRFAPWDARLVVVVPAPPHAAAHVAPDAGGALTVLADPDGVLDALGRGVVVADEWGEVYHAAEAGERHELPDPAELEEWARFVAIQCPECEGPEGEWCAL